jgi:hypothetical protein
MSEQVTKTIIPATVEEGESIAAGLFRSRTVVLDFAALLRDGWTFDSLIDVTGSEVTVLLLGEEEGGDQDRPVDARDLSCQGLAACDYGPDMVPTFHGRPVEGWPAEVERRGGLAHVNGCELVGHMGAPAPS